MGLKILLINCPREGEVVDNTTPDYLLYDFMNYPPLGLMAIGAGVSSIHSLKLLDTITENMKISEVLDYVDDYKPDVLGISVVTRRLYSMVEIANQAKKKNKNIITVAGGPHVNYFPNETMSYGSIDYALTGYCESTFPKLIEMLWKKNNGVNIAYNIENLYYKENCTVKRTSPIDKPTVLDELPFPDRSLIDLKKYFTAADKKQMTTMYSSRGCPFRCVFCDVQDKRYHYRSAKSIVDEMQYIISLGIEEVHIFDDTFNLIKNRVVEICDEIIRKKLKLKWSARARVSPIDKELLGKMKEAGCARLHVGVEALDDEILKKIKKKINMNQIQNFFSLCNELKIDTLAYFILGFPYETISYRNNIMNELKKLNPTYIYFNILFPTPKSEYYEMLLSDGVYEKDYWKEFIERPTKDFMLPLPRSVEEHKQLIQIVNTIHKRFYLSPRFIMNDLKRKTTAKMLIRKATMGLKLIFKY